MPVAQLSAERLRCEYRVNPMGIDEKRPRFDWLLKSSVRGQKQTAYQILVASSLELLKRDEGDLWDSGKVASGETCQIEYAGKTLSSRMQCFWKVRVWDRDRKPSDWSKVAQWSMGLLKQSDWKAQWIGYDEPLKGEYELLGLEDARWIWTHEEEPNPSAHPTSRFFRKTIDVPKSMKIRKAVLFVFNQGTKDVGIGGWRTYLNGKLIDTQDFRHHLRSLDVTQRIKPGRNSVAVEAAIAKPKSDFIAKFVVFPEKGEPKVWVSDKTWKYSTTEQAKWHQPEFNDRSWKPAKDLCGYTRKLYKIATEKNLWKSNGLDHRLPPPRYLRKPFQLNKKVKRATVYATALGLYQLWINEKRVGNDEFTPGWTEYPVRCNYQTYDVTAMLRTGKNAIGAILADGWHSGYIAGNNRRSPYGDKTRLRTQLEVEYDDGTKDVICTDRSWKGGLGPLREADIMKGAMYDARLEIPWTDPEFNASDWASVNTSQHDPQHLRAHPGNPVQAVGEFKPKKITRLGKGHYVFNLGRNIAGVCRLKITAKRGTKITLRHGEWLQNDGTVYIDNLGSARAEDTYICRGGGEETWTPPFTFHGFQYVEAFGLPDEPSKDLITGIAWSAQAPKTIEFKSLDPTTNQLISNVYWTQRANFIDVPTDCPQRAERLGWTGDAQMYIRTASYVADIAAFFTKWIRDLNDAQLPTGAFPNFAPRMHYGEGPHAWADAGVICPWSIYLVYGDRRMLAESYVPMTRWIEYCRENSEGLIRPMQQWGDWLSINSITPREVIGTAYFAYSTSLIAQCAEILGKKADAKKYHRLFEDIKSAFRKKFVSDDGRVEGDSQTAYVLALQFDLLNEKEAALAKEHLRADIEERGVLSTGFVGTKDLMTCLNKIGLNDLAYRLFHNETFPSWVYPIKQGATSIWERWDGLDKRDDGTIRLRGSLSHYAYGAVAEWVFRVIGGIDLIEPGYKKIRIQPQPGGKIDWAKTRYDSIHGAIETNWRVHNGQMTLNVTIPPGVRAEVLLPCGDPAKITEGNKKLKKAKDVVIRSTDDGKTVCEISSGIYQFAIRKNA